MRMHLTQADQSDGKVIDGIEVSLNNVDENEVGELLANITIRELDSNDKERNVLVQNGDPLTIGNTIWTVESMTPPSAEGLDSTATLSNGRRLLLAGGVENWRLDDSIDLADLRKAIDTGVQKGEAVEVPVYLPDEQQTKATLILNCRVAPSVVLVENVEN